MKRFFRQGLAAIAFSAVMAGSADAAELRGSPASMTRQHRVAVEAGYDFVERPGDVEPLVDEGKLVRFDGNDDYDASIVRYPYALPEMRTFIERLSAQYREATGEKLVLTGLTRPSTRQPVNAHRLSVHPAGMAVDLRIPKRASDRAWLENALLGLESRGMLDLTRERDPPHYHVAVFPDAYRAFVAERLAAEAEAERERRAATFPAVLPGAPAPSGSETEGGRRAWLTTMLLLAPLPIVAALR